MLNVVKFHKEALRVRRHTTKRGRQVGADIPGLMERFKGPQSRARTEPGDTILLLDLAAQPAHRLVKTINDSRVEETDRERSPLH